MPTSTLNIMIIPMAITTDRQLSRLRLLHLVSPSLPVGAFTYSQGLEWAVECGWVTNEASLLEWVANLMETSMQQLEVPLLARLYQACAENDDQSLAYWSHYLIASRETRELREEEHNRARALVSLLPELGMRPPAHKLPLLKKCQLAGFAFAAEAWQVPLHDAAAGYLWGWLENITLAGVKIIPLGQAAGQRIIAELTVAVPHVVELGLQLGDDAIGASCTAQAIASSLHETQYTRIYRS